MKPKSYFAMGFGLLSGIVALVVLNRMSEERQFLRAAEHALPVGASIESAEAWIASRGFKGIRMMVGNSLVGLMVENESSYLVIHLDSDERVERITSGRYDKKQ